jgi:hypothetical protein
MIAKGTKRMLWAVWDGSVHHTECVWLTTYGAERRNLWWAPEHGDTGRSTFGEGVRVFATEVEAISNILEATHDGGIPLY